METTQAVGALSGSLVSTRLRRLDTTRRTHGTRRGWALVQKVRGYDVRAFLIDIALIALLYGAFASAKLSPSEKAEEPALRLTAILMAGVYAVFLLWTWHQQPELEPHGRREWMTLVTIHIVAIPVFLLLAVRPSAWLVLAGVTIFGALETRASLRMTRLIP